MAIELTTADSQTLADILGAIEQDLIGQTWEDPTVPQSFSNYGDVEVQLDGTVSGVGFSRSVDGASYYPCLMFADNFTYSTTVSSPGIYRLPGGGYLKQTSGSPATVTTYRAST